MDKGLYFCFVHSSVEVVALRVCKSAGAEILLALFHFVLKLIMIETSARFISVYFHDAAMT
jgi:hypothetical protein